MAEGMEENVAKQQAEKAVILVQGSLIGVADLRYESLKMQFLNHCLRLVSRCMQNSISYPD
jgi:hypothetical protein